MANTVKNESGETVYLKVKDQLMELEDGEEYTGDIDGVWVESKPDQLYKIVDFADATVEPGGNVDPLGPDIIHEEVFGGGWKNGEEFTNQHPDWKPFYDGARKRAGIGGPLGGGGPKKEEGDDNPPV